MYLQINLWKKKFYYRGQEEVMTEIGGFKGWFDGTGHDHLYCMGEWRIDFDTLSWSYIWISDVVE